MKLKTLLFSGIMTIMVATPVFAFSGHSYFKSNHDDCNLTSTCNEDGPKHMVALIVTQNKSANQTYAEAQCACSEHGVGAQIKLGTRQPEKHGVNQINVGASSWGILPASEVHNIDY